jgi:CubicO group peptidase (beta-lactamase class C family)
MKRTLFILFVLLSVSFTRCTTGKPSAQQNLPASQDQEVSKLIEEYNHPDKPGGAIMVIRDGKVIYSRGFGLANLSHEVPFQVATPTNIGSTTKQFTAFGIALLQQQGLLSVDDDIRKYIPELPDLGETVKIRHLLSHSSGYREYLNLLLMSGRNLSDMIKTEEIIPVVQRQGTLQNVPGETFNYNNTGYALLAMVIERITGTSYAEWMKENVFLPLGMTHTVVRTNPWQVIPGSAQGYIHTEKGFIESPDIHASLGAGGIYTTLPDLARWILNFYNPVVGNESLMETMQTPFLLNNGDPTNYAYGLMIGKLRGLKMVEHGGSDLAHRSMLMMFPEVKGAVITQSNNSTFPGQISRKVAEIFFDDVMQPKKEDKNTPSGQGEFVYDVQKFDELAGRYELAIAPGFILEFRREGDKLLTQATGQQAVELFASSDSTFFLKVVQAGVTFHRNEEGKVMHITLHQGGHHRGNRVLEPAWKPSAEDIAMYSGRYFSPELETFYTIVYKDENLVLQHRRIDDLVLKADSKDLFTSAFPVTEIKFIRNAAGEVICLEASNIRATGVVFEKSEK